MPRVHNATPVVIVQHPREARHPFGTVRIARLGLVNVRVIVAHRRLGEVARCADVAPAGSALLFPAADATPLADAAPISALVVVDGTWPNARGLVRDNPWLQRLPKVALQPKHPGRYRIRLAPDPRVQLSTIEAVVGALQHLEPNNHALQGLLVAFETMIDRQIALRWSHGRPEDRRDCADDDLVLADT